MYIYIHCKYIYMCVCFVVKPPELFFDIGSSSNHGSATQQTRRFTNFNIGIHWEERHRDHQRSVYPLVMTNIAMENCNF